MAGELEPLHLQMYGVLVPLMVMLIKTLARPYVQFSMKSAVFPPNVFILTSPTWTLVIGVGTTAHLDKM